jgi:glycosyltransferase involved in cell wall biosynthesis
MSGVEEGRIALVTPRYPPAIGGVELHVGQVARRLAAGGAEVDVITTDPTGELPPLEEAEGVTIRRFPTLARDDVFYLSPSLGRWLMANAFRYSIIHAHSYHTPLAVVSALAARRRGLPLVITPHYHGTGHSRLARVLHVPYGPVGLWALRRADAVVTNSEAERTLVRQRFGRGLRPVLIRPGVEVEEFLVVGGRPPRAPDAGVSVVAGGRLEPYKQVDRVVDAMAHLPFYVRLAVLGDGPARGAIEEAARAPGVAGRVESLGYVAREELVHRYRTADVFVSLSEREAFGLTVLEAAVAGAAVVASDIPAHREIAGLLPDGVIRLVPVHAPATEVAAAIAEAAEAPRPATDPTTWDIPTWDQTADACRSLYASLVAGARQGSAQTDD